MALISDKVVFRLKELFPTEKFELVNGNKSLLINGKSFHSYFEGEELEKFGKLGIGYQQSIIQKMQVEIVEFLQKGEKVFEVPEEKVFVEPEKKVPSKPEKKVYTKPETDIDPENQKVFDSVDDDKDEK